MMTSETKTANAIGGKTARACDSCLSKRARWFCPADDAFLCQSCDVSVHSANQLASRHERVRLETSSNKSTITKSVDKTDHQPAWHQGFTRKARTPRNGKKTQLGQRTKVEENRVPEIGSEENSPDENEYENEEQLLYQVPVFDPFEAELCSSSVPDETATNVTDLDMLLNSEDACDDLNLPEFLSSNIELAEFAADVESLLGEDFGVIVQEEEEEEKDTKAIKIEVEDEEMRAVVACHLDPELDMAREALKWNFDEYDEETVEQKVLAATEFVVAGAECSKADTKRRLLLRLNHEEVIRAWPHHSSPWTNGIRPHLNPDDCWPDFLESCGGRQEYGGHVRSGDGGREARVSRYREKRRTRLFSKKIRYQVRKLNAEKRPRLKGRFIKRTSSSFSAPSYPYNLMNKR